MPAAPPAPPGPPEDPSDPSVWKRAYLELLPKAYKEVRSLPLARDILQAAILKANALGPACWDPSRGRLIPYLQALLIGVARNERRRAVYRRETRDDLAFEETQAETPSALDAILRSERVREDAALVEELRADLAAAKDDEAVLVLDTIGDDTFKLSHIAAATGLALNTVDNARRRIRRAYLELLAAR